MTIRVRYVDLQCLLLNNLFKTVSNDQQQKKEAYTTPLFKIYQLSLIYILQDSAPSLVILQAAAVASIPFSWIPFRT